MVGEAAKAFDVAAPKGDLEEHEAFRRHLRETVERAADRIKRINSAVHYKSQAEELPDLPAPSRLTQPIPPVFPPLGAEAVALQVATGLKDAVGGKATGQEVRDLNLCIEHA